MLIEIELAVSREGAAVRYWELSCECNDTPPSERTRMESVHNMSTHRQTFSVWHAIRFRAQTMDLFTLESSFWSGGWKLRFVQL